VAGNLGGLKAGGYNDHRDGKGEQEQHERRGYVRVALLAEIARLAAALVLVFAPRYAGSWYSDAGIAPAAGVDADMRAARTDREAHTRTRHVQVKAGKYADSALES
jgi:hypothetical protein